MTGHDNSFFVILSGAKDPYHSANHSHAPNAVTLSEAAQFCGGVEGLCISSASPRLRGEIAFNQAFLRVLCVSVVSHMPDAPQFATYDDFFAYYVKQHSDPRNR